MIHIVICDNKTKELDKIINKERTVLLRGNAKRRIPHSRIFINDELYFVDKGSNKSFYHAIVKNADSYSKLTSLEIEDIFSKYKDRLNLCEVEENKWKNKCICVIEFDNLEKIEGLDIPNYTPLEDWIMVNSLDELNNR
ncbi:MAG: hypothetical protein IJD92_02765 [Bacilli bacterium]|nr:hypothetical protein [Bacilli bacterium]